MYNQFSESILLPSLIQIRNNLTMAKFELMKILPAKYIIEKALSQGKINPNIPIVETSSGTFALSLGLVCSEKKIPFFIIGDSAIDERLKSRLIQLGGEVQILSDILTKENPQIIRLKILKEYLDMTPDAYWTCQYDNLDNQISYHCFADYLIDSVGKDFTLVAAVGSGGSACGTIKRVREVNSSIRLVGVDTFGSVIFGQENKKRILRGLGNSIVPKNVTHHYFDEVHWVNGNDAFYYTRKLNSEKGLFCGPTTGATYQVANWIAENNPHQNVVFISADTGDRYQETVFKNDWLLQNSLNYIPTKNPVILEKPFSASNEKWSYFNWNRRFYHEIIG